MADSETLRRVHASRATVSEERQVPKAKTSNYRGVLAIAAVLGVVLGAVGFMQTSTREEAFSIAVDDINRKAAQSLPHRHGGALVKHAVFRFGNEAEGQFQIDNEPYAYTIKGNGTLGLSGGVIHFNDVRISVLEESKTGADLGDNLASWAPSGWSWARRGLRAVASPVDGFQGKAARSDPMQAARNFPIYHLSGAQVRAVEAGEVSGVYARPGGVEVVVSHWDMGIVPFVSILALMAGLALSFVLWTMPDFGREEI